VNFAGKPDERAHQGAARQAKGTNMKTSRMFRSQSAPAVGLLLAFTLLAGCEDAPRLGFLQPADTSNAATTGTGQQSTKLVERDVEAPDVFQVTEAGLWDGRPSLGGVWVAHPDVGDPERVIIRNDANGKFVIGALFRREREIPGPRVQVSSDAAAALGMLAGAPVELNVTALRREAVAETPPAPVQTASLSDQEVAASLPSDEITASALDPIAQAAAAIEAAGNRAKPAAKPAAHATETAAVVAATAPRAKPSATGSSLGKPFIQIGIFNVKDNANRTADQMRSAGMLPTVKEQTSRGKTFWRVVVGPAKNRTERTALLKQIRKTGFSDAYAVTN
jgi:cell division septation protein DedD